MAKDDILYINGFLYGDVNMLHININDGIINYESIQVTTNLMFISIRKQLSRETKNLQFFAMPYSESQIVSNRLNVFNLTKMFGSGHEPTKEQCEALFTQASYRKHIIQK